jgi:two-component system, sensor histidine kinase and response regulator
MTRPRVLIVDDDVALLQALPEALRLRMEAVTTDTCDSALAALDLIAATDYDAVVTDIKMPGMDGLALLERIKSLRPDTPTLLITGHGERDLAVRALRGGAYDFIQKPIDRDYFVASLSRAVQRRQLGRQVEQQALALRRHAEELERTVEERTRDLRQANRDLARANEEIEMLYQGAQRHVDELKELDELKSRFLSMASHELKTPLTTLIGASQLMSRRLRRRLEQGRPSEEDWDREQRTLLQQTEMLAKQTEKLARLVDELLDVSRIESGKVEYRFAPVNVHRLACDVAARMQLTADRHDIRVATASSESLTIMADQDHLEQVLNNLLSNAIKYSPDGGTILLEARPDGESVVLSVQDQGLGIPKDQLDAVFGLFYRVPSSGERSAGGVGLGLYISKEIVARHRGRIWVDSETGRGSTFYVALPRTPPAAEDNGRRQLPDADRPA